MNSLLASAPSRRLAFVLSALFLVAGLAGAEAPQDRPNPLAADAVWITLGADAFQTLRTEGLSFDHQPLRAEDENSGAVLTRVHTRDLDHISLRLHEVHRRCSGFFVHQDRADAEAALERFSKAELLGAPIEYIIDQGPLVTSYQADLVPGNILATITSLSTEFNNRYYSHPSGEDGAVWIRDLWQSYAQDRPEVTVELYDHSWRQPSVILTIPGSTLADEVVVLGGHLDSTSFGSSNPNFLAPGADDNASGIATLSEVIRVAMERGFAPKRTVKFMGYAAEEVGLLGSQAIASEYQNTGVNVVAVLQLDMTAFNGSIQDIGLLSDNTNDVLTAFVADLIDTYQPELEWISTACGYACSDHASWNSQGYPAAMSFEARVGQHNSAIHTTSDTTATFGNTADHSIKFARLAAAFMIEIGIDVTSSIFADGFESGNLSAWTEQIP